MMVKRFIFPLFALLIAASPVSAKKVSPESVTGAVTIDVQKAKEMFDKGVPFVDVRKNSDWDAGRIPGAKHVELKKVFNAAELEKAIGGKDKEVVLYCNGPSCMRSSQACEKAVGWGFTKVYYFRLGFPAWQEAGLPTE